MTEFQLESGDAGQALLPVPVSAIAERVKRADASRSDVGKVKGEGARRPNPRLVQMRALSGDQRRWALAFLAGYAPETFDRLMQYVREGR